MNRLKKIKGFTLIELLVALAITGTILLAFFKIIDGTNRMNAKNDRDIKALNIAQSEIENLRNQIKNHEQTGKLYIEDIKDITTNNVGFEFDNVNKKISITLENDKNYNVTYKKDIDEKEFEIHLDISKSKVKAQNNSIDTGIYLYIINIKVKSIDEYFTKKETEIQDVKVLSKNKG